MKIKFLEKINSRYFKKASFSALAILTLSLGQFFVITPAQAADPQFNTFTPYVHTQTYNRDYYLLDAKNDTQGTTWGFPVSANAGDLLTFYVYYHNSTNNSTAANTTVRVAMPSGQSTSQSVVASLWADNATNATAANPFTQSLPVNINSSQTLQYVSGSAKWFPNQADWRTAAPTAFPNGQSGDQLFSSGINFGNVQGCWEFSSAIVFQARVGNTSANAPDLSVTKMVRNQTAGQSNFSSNVNAANNDRLNFQIRIANTGNTNLNNVIVRDNAWPSQLSYVAGSSQNNGAAMADGIINGDVNIGSIAQGATRTITFDALVNYSSGSSLNVTNTAYARADQVSEKSALASVYLAGTVSGTGSLTINKTVRNTTSGQGSYSDYVNAANNDRLMWQIQIQNTGNTTLNNVFSYDTLPGNISYISGSSRVDGAYVSDGVTAGGINLGSLATGATKTITFETYASASYASNQNLTNYAYARADQVSERSDSAVVSISGTGSSSGSLIISKSVRNLTSSQNSLSVSTSANPGDRVLFLIQVSTPVNSQTLTNVRVWDALPAGLTYISGSTRVDNGYTNDGLVTGGINLGTLYGNQNRSINFEATVNSNYNSATLINYAYAAADGIPQNSAFAQVVLNQTTPSLVSSNLYKRVENLTSPNGTNTDNTASVGDTLRYTISYTNNTGATLTNTQVLDVLPSYTTYYSVDGNGFYSNTTNMITWNFASIPPGSTVTTSYQAKIQNVPSNNYLIANTAALRADNLSLINSNETRTIVNATVIPPTPAVKGVSVTAVTGGDNVARNLVISLMASLWGIFFLYLFLENQDLWRDARFRLAIWRIRVKEKIV